MFIVIPYRPAEEELISTRLEPVMEDEENILRIPMGDEISAKSEQVSNASSSPRRKAELQHGLKDFELKEDDASSADGVSRKRKAGGNALVLVEWKSCRQISNCSRLIG